MATPYIMPLGFIDRPTEDGAILTLSNPEDSLSLRSDTPVTVWRYSPEQLALAKMRGLISAVGYVTATFRTVEFQIDPRWPEDEEILRQRTPVYLALEATFEPDPGRMLTREQAERMRNAAAQYRKLRSGDPQDEENRHRLDEDKQP